jgi:hypothetical protein
MLKRQEKNQYMDNHHSLVPYNYEILYKDYYIIYQIISFTIPNLLVRVPLPHVPAHDPQVVQLTQLPFTITQQQKHILHEQRDKLTWIAYNYYNIKRKYY